ncbi:hypothetical protein [Tabrizicola sp.]|uniref:hypothetical protein n=1 Tax=Tabrizicola sp. TaxID=2005166 RepID=UPI003F3D7A6B
MTLDSIRFLPELIPLTDAEKMVWRGPTEHIGPVADFTPLQKELSYTTSCGLYLLYIGCTGLMSRRMVQVMNINLNNALSEQIFCYQFDWRYPKPFGITLADIEENPDRVLALRRTVPFFFFEAIRRSNGFFLSTSPVADIAFVVNLTRHVCGKENAITVDGWIKGFIDRLGEIAPNPNPTAPVLQEFPTRADWEREALRNHGTPLPLGVLDLRQSLAGADLATLAAEDMRKVVPADNPLLQPPEALVAQGLAEPYSGLPYQVGQ